MSRNVKDGGKKHTHANDKTQKMNLDPLDRALTD